MKSKYKDFNRGDCIQVNTSDPNSKDSFHRCYVCGEYPELAGPVGIKVALDNRGFYWGICSSCVIKMYNTLKGSTNKDI